MKKLIYQKTFLNKNFEDVHEEVFTDIVVNKIEGEKHFEDKFERNSHLINVLSNCESLYFTAQAKTVAMASAYIYRDMKRSPIIGVGFSMLYGSSDYFLVSYRAARDMMRHNVIRVKYFDSGDIVFGGGVDSGAMLDSGKMRFKMPDEKTIKLESFRKFYETIATRIVDEVIPSYSDMMGGEVDQHRSANDTKVMEDTLNNLNKKSNLN